MPKGLLARKLGMTQVFNADGTVSAVTVLEVGPCRVLGLRTVEKDGYAAVRLAFAPVAERKVSKPLLGEFKKAGADPHRHVAEVRGYDGLEVGQELKCDVFAEGELVDVTSTSKGKGFQGLRMAGQMGNRRTTVQGLRVVRVDGKRNLLLLRGGVPGGDGGVVLVKESVKQLRKAR